MKRITVGVENRALSHVGTVGPAPKDITGAQFSSHFSLGLTTVKGRNDFSAYYEALNNGFSDAGVLNVARKVTVVHDQEAEEIYPKTRLGKVTLETVEGQQYQAKVFHPKGSPENPLTRAELHGKFLGLSSMVVTSQQAQDILGSVQNLESVNDLGEISSMLTSDR